MLVRVLRGFRSARDPSQWRTSGVSALPEAIPVTPVAEEKAPQPSTRPPGNWTQADQDTFDEESRDQAREALTQSWKDKLSTISLITTFFVGTEAQLLGTTAPGNGNETSKLGYAANAGLMGALVIHSFAAIVSFAAAFFLISYTLREATLELKVERTDLERTDSYNSIEDDQNHVHQRQHHVHERSVTKHNTRIVQVCRFNQSLPPVRLLKRCSHLCMFLTALGFALEIIGIICFAWDQMGVVVSSFASGLTLFCLAASAAVMRPAI